MTGKSMFDAALSYDEPVGVFARSGNLEVRLAGSKAELREAQRLRYRIFFEEMQARATGKARVTRLDIDPFDKFCDHLLVLDRGRRRGQQVVGCYRLLRQEIAEANKGFYSAGEFDLSPLKALSGGQLLELGRSCVHPDYRSGSTITLLWSGIAAYLKIHDIGWLFGCASFEGADPSEHAEALSWLHHHHLVGDDVAVTALPDVAADLDILPLDEIDERAARRALPPLIKGYLRVGCKIGRGAVVDEAFGTTDVFVLLPVDRIASRYGGHFDV